MDYSGIAAEASKAFSNELLPETQAARSEARFKKAESEENLRRLQATKPTDSDLRSVAEQQSLKLQQQEMQLKELMATQVKKTTYDGLDKFFEDGDARHLRQTIKEVGKTEIGRSLFGDQLSNIATLSDSENDRKLIQMQLGANPDLILGHPELQKKYVKVLDNKGAEKIVDLMSFVGTTDYNLHARSKSLELQNKMAQLEKGVIDAYPLAKETKKGAAIFTRLQGAGLDPTTPEFKTKFFDEWNASEELEYTRAMALKKAGVALTENESKAADNIYMRPTATATERDIHSRVKQKLIDEDKLNVTNGTAEYAKIYDELAARDRGLKERGDTAKTLDDLDRLTSEIDVKSQKFGAKDFLSMDPNKLEEIRPTIANEMSALEKHHPIPATILKDIVEYKSIVDIASSVGEMSAEQTGAFDSFLFGAGKYTSDDTKGIVASSAYNTIRNELRHKLYGSALTQPEIDSFNKAFGTELQQLGPLLAYFKQNVGVIKSKLEAITSTVGNQHLMKYKTGASIEQTKTLMDNLEKLAAGLQTNTPAGVAAATQRLETTAVKNDSKAKAKARLEQYKANARARGNQQ